MGSGDITLIMALADTAREDGLWTVQQPAFEEGLRKALKKEAIEVAVL